MLLQLLMRITFTQFSIFQNLPGVDIAHNTMFNMTCTAHMFVASFNNTRQNFNSKLLLSHGTQLVDVWLGPLPSPAIGSPPSTKMQSMLALVAPS